MGNDGVGLGFGVGVGEVPGVLLVRGATVPPGLYLGGHGAAIVWAQKSNGAAVQVRRVSQIDVRCMIRFLNIGEQPQWILSDSGGLPRSRIAIDVPGTA